jgi:FkbM family methyltransferase
MSTDRIPGIIVRTEVEGRPVSFFVTTDQDTIMGQNAYGYFYELEELAIMRRHSIANAVFLDVGANIGNHTIYFAKLLDARQVICIEPNPEAIRILRVNIDLNQLQDRVDLTHIGCGLSDHVGRAIIGRTIEMNLGGTTLEPRDDGTIALVPGDKLLNGRNVDFIKIDVEGMELKVLQGLEQTISRFKPNIFVEVNNANLGSFREWAKQRAYEIVDSYDRYGVQENFMLVAKRSGAG